MPNRLRNTRGGFFVPVFRGLSPSRIVSMCFSGPHRTPGRRFAFGDILWGNRRNPSGVPPHGAQGTRSPLRDQAAKGLQARRWRGPVPPRSAQWLEAVTDEVERGRATVARPVQGHGARLRGQGTRTTSTQSRAGATAASQHRANRTQAGALCRAAAQRAQLCKAAGPRPAGIARSNQARPGSSTAHRDQA